ncbi:MAG TPA: hypothetical protein VK858_09975 [Longimicrobiales bacterium]|nr:hypothetical protein [Longimicrobiales bacterium]
MIRFTDRDGRSWEIVAGRESWGAIVALFIPTQDGATIRQSPLPAAGYEEATTRLEAMTPAEVQELLDGSEPKTL